MLLMQSRNVVIVGTLDRFREYEINDTSRDRLRRNCANRGRSRMPIFSRTSATNIVQGSRERRRRERENFAILRQYPGKLTPKTAISGSLFWDFDQMSEFSILRFSKILRIHYFEILAQSPNSL